MGATLGVNFLLLDFHLKMNLLILRAVLLSLIAIDLFIHKNAPIFLTD